MNANPTVYFPAFANITRAASFAVRSLYTRGFYGKNAKIGLIRADFPSTARARDQGLKPALRKYGLSLALEEPVTLTDASGYVSAVLRFRQAGVTHVHFMDQTGTLSSMFMARAEDQEYRPRYALNSDSATAQLALNAPAEQLRNAIGVGWMPTTDLAAPQDTVPTPREKECLGIMQKAGVETPGRFGQNVALWTCDSLFFLKAALDRAHDITQQGLRLAAENLGEQYAPASTLGSRVAAGRHDGASKARPLAFDPACSCFKYTGPAVEFP